MRKELPRRWIKGSLIGIILLCLLSMIGAVLLAKEIVPVKAIGIMRGCVLALSVAVSCYLAQRRSPCGSLPVAMGTTVALLLVSALLHVLLAREQPWHFWSVPLALIVMLLTALLGAGRKRRY